MQGPALLIDGKNTAYRAVFGGRNDNCHPFVTWLRLTTVWLEKLKPSSVHVFWDCHKQDIWRRKVLEEYKANRGETDPAIRDALWSLETVAREVLPWMNIRTYSRDTQEADDLIYSASRALAPNKVIIVSGDSDMTQIPWLMGHVKVFEPRKGEFVDFPEVNPIIQKALTGDNSDNISGYYGIGPVKSRDMMSDPKLLQEFFAIRGDKEFRRNLALIDLSMNPSRISNEMYVYQKLAEPIVFDKGAIVKKIQEHKISGLATDYSRIVVPFKRLGSTEENQ